VLTFRIGRPPAFWGQRRHHAPLGRAGTGRGHHRCFRAAGRGRSSARQARPGDGPRSLVRSRARRTPPPEMTTSWHCDGTNRSRRRCGFLTLCWQRCLHSGLVPHAADDDRRRCRGEQEAVFSSARTINTRRPGRPRRQGGRTPISRGSKSAPQIPQA
jgi:hypothetical protein